MTKTWCVGGREYSEPYSQKVFEKVNPKTKEFVKTRKGNCDICGRARSQFLTK